ncbi:uncharacterized protein LOC134022865 isoform X2 [Osmerus eperlanus]|uniref:uncharacterized protein LOC134022865 isoform X2 n=1 Tax=Osmerus eperlanus TaxID=29151 RepID=UPI002E14BD8B
MLRRSARLVTGGSYQQSDDSDSSSTSLSCRQSPVHKRNRTFSDSLSTSSSYAGLSHSANEPISNGQQCRGMAGALRAASGGPCAPVFVQTPASARTPHCLSSSSGPSSSSTSSSSLFMSVPAPCRTRCSVGAAVNKAVLDLLFISLFTIGLWYMYPVLTYVFTLPLKITDRTISTNLPVTDSTLENQLTNILTQMELLQQKAFERDLELQKVQYLSEWLQTDVKDIQIRLEKLDTDLSRQMSDIHSITTTLRQRMEEREINTVKLQQAQMSLTPPGPASSPSSSITPELEKELDKWLCRKNNQYRDIQPNWQDCVRSQADKRADFAIESQGASVLQASETYQKRSTCLKFFGIPLFYPSESPRTVLQGNHVMKPGRCWPMPGSQGFLAISLSHPIAISHVTLDHLPRYNHPTGEIHSAPKDFLVYGTSVEGGEKTLLGTFTYDKDGDSSQTFQIPSADDTVYHSVELRVLSNWGNQEYTCLYRFRVHGQTPRSS